jgi:hypothetical protein
MKNSSEKPKRKLSHPLLGARGFGVKNLPEGVSYADQYREELKSLTAPERTLVMRQRREYLNILGIKNFKQLENRSEDFRFSHELLENMAEHLASYVVPRQVENPKLRHLLAKAELPRLSDNANEFMNWVLDRLVPGGEADNLDVTNDVIACADPAQLVLIANDREKTGELKTGLSPEDRRAKVMVRFEALRKSYLMLLMAQVNAYRKDRNDDLAYFNGLMSQHIYSPELGYGEHKTRYLVSEHWVRDNANLDENSMESNHQCVAWEVCSDRKMAQQDVDQGRREGLPHQVQAQGVLGTGSPRLKRIMTPIAMRSFDVEEDGERKTIEFRVHTRFKTQNSCLQKLIRKDMRLKEDPSQVISDLSGVRFVMENEEHIRLFWKKFNEDVGKSHQIEVVEEQDSVGKGGALKCKKYDLKIDGRPYEFQFFTFPQYADYEYSQPHSRDAYEIRRFYESSCSEALFPTEIYGDFDRKEYEKNAVRKMLSEHSFRVRSGMDQQATT